MSPLNSKSFWLNLAYFQTYFGRISSSLILDDPPDASHLCAYEKGRGLAIQGEPCKRVSQP